MIYKYAIIGAGYALALTFFWLFLDAREDLAAERVQCNADKLATAQESSEIARKAQKESDDRRIAELARQRDAAERAAAIAAEGLAEEQQGKAELAAELKQLELDAFDEDLPDSNACLNVFVPAGPYRLLYAQNRVGPGAGGDGEGSADTDPGALSEGNAAGFAAVTFGDTLAYWRDDRGALIACNADKRAIRELNP